MFKNRKKNNNKSEGFTLIELLVVIAIIGILSSVVLASLNTARVKARNGQRISDLRQIQLALEFYFDAQSTPAYPATVVTLVPTYLPIEPKDPSTTAIYGYSETGTDYCLGTTLEAGTAIPTNNDTTCAGSLGVNYAVSP